MPLYEYECKSCNSVFDMVRSIHEDVIYSYCPKCHALCFKILSKPNMHIFKPQNVNIDDSAPFVRNRQELTDAVNKFNDTEIASVHGKVAVA